MQTDARSLPSFPFPRPLAEGLFVRRVNRFVAEIEVEGSIVRAHVPNTGRMTELLVAGAPVMLLPRQGAHRKTNHDLLLVQYNGIWVCTDSREANRVVEDLLMRLTSGEKLLLPNPDAEIWHILSGLTGFQREASYEGHRIDFALYRGDNQVGLLEVKSVNLVENGTALFPDAPTLRGQRHVDLLHDATLAGTPCHVVFAVQRSDAERFRPHSERDPAFAAALSRAAKAGVGIHAFSLDMSPAGAALCRVLPVRL